MAANLMPELNEEVTPPRFETSVQRTEGLAEAAIWNAGRATRNVALRGRVDLSRAIVEGASLQVSPDEPPPGHAVILGWPETEKQDRMSCALQLAAAGTLTSVE